MCHKVTKVRELTGAEILAIERVKARRPVTLNTATKLKVCFVTQGNFTTAIVKNGKRMWVGVTKRTPTDENEPERAETIAICRAAECEPIGL